MTLACSTASRTDISRHSVLLNDDTATTPTDHSSGRANPHRHYPPAKSRLSLTPFLTQHKVGPRFFGVRPNLNGMRDVDSEQVVTSVRSPDAPRYAGAATGLSPRALKKVQR
jgi:hypothetical protein